jgi:short-subunit dehydrogenase
VRVIARDLASAAAARELADTLDTYGVEIDLLVNNAGVALPGFFSSQSADDLATMVELNVVALTVLTRRVLEGMLLRRRGRILNVASLAGFQPLPGLGAYAATKAYVLALTEALSEELKGTGVTVTALCPGLTDTDMAAQLTDINSALPDFSQLFMASVESVAREGIDATLRGEAIRVPGMLNQAASLWTQVQPRRFLRRVSGFFARQFVPD